MMKTYLNGLIAIASLSLLGVAGQAYSDGGELRRDSCTTRDDPVYSWCANETCAGGGTIFEPAQGYQRWHEYECCDNGHGTDTIDHQCFDLPIGCCSILSNNLPPCPTSTNCPH